MTALRKLADLPPPERRLLLAAAALVPALRLALLALPFPVVTRAVARLAHLRATPADAPGPERIAWAVHAAARRVPLGAGCLAQALATQILLARCGHPARLRIGVARTTDHRSPPVSRRRHRRVRSGSISPRRAARPGSRSGGNGAPSSSNRSKRRRSSARSTAMRSAPLAKPSMRAAAAFA